jgi:hypothetical protein
VKDGFFIDIARIGKKNSLQDDNIRVEKDNKTGKTRIAVYHSGSNSAHLALNGRMIISMAIRFSKMHVLPADILRRIIDISLEKKGLPEKFMFLFIEIDVDGEIRMAEFGNPLVSFIRNRQLYTPSSDVFDSGNQNMIRLASFYLFPEDRVFIQIHANQLNKDYMFLDKSIQKTGRPLSAREAGEVFCQGPGKATGLKNLLSIYIRKPRSLMICTGPPYKKENDGLMAQKFRQYEGDKIIAGGTTTNVVARELKADVQTLFETNKYNIPPKSAMEGASLVTEGYLTLRKVVHLLRSDHEVDSGESPAHEIVNYIRNNDRIDFLVGGAINVAQYDPGLPVEVDMRRNIVRDISDLVKEKLLKETSIEFI